MEVLTNNANKVIYFDHAATTPIDPQVASGMWWWLTQGYGNPSSAHYLGRLSEKALQNARHKVANLIGAQDYEIIFTSGGTEANNLALWGVINRAAPHQNRIITSAIEHAAILNNIPALQARGFQVTILPVDSQGRVAAQDLEQALDHDVALVSIMYANNEVGTIQDISNLAQITKARGVLFHTDAVQASGLLPTNVNELGVDLLSLSAHKIYGPKGIGCLYVKDGIQLSPLIFGGEQEFGIRSGTENVSSIIGFGIAAELAWQRLGQVSTLENLRDYLEVELRQFPEIMFHGNQARRLPNICCFGIRDYLGNDLVTNLDLHGFACSSGSACHKQQMSYVLQAMGCTPEQASSGVRISLGWSSTKADIDSFIFVLKELLRRVVRRN